MKKLIALDFTRLICYIRKDVVEKGGYFEGESYTAFYHRMKKMKEEKGEKFDFFEFFKLNLELLELIENIKNERDDIEFIIFAHKTRKGFAANSYYEPTIHEDPLIKKWLVDELGLFKEIVSTYESKSIYTVFSHYRKHFTQEVGFDEVFFIEKESCNVMSARQGMANVIHIDDFGRNPARALKALISRIDKGENISGFFFEKEIK